MSDNGIKQLSRRPMESLFKKFCKTVFPKKDECKLWRTFNAGGAVVFAENDTIRAVNSENLKNPAAFANGVEDDPVPDDFDTYINFELFESRMQAKIKPDNLFECDVNRYFTIFLCCYRPDFYICPVKCVLQTYSNIVSHKVNAINYYRENNKVTFENNFDNLFSDCFRKAFFELCLKMPSQELGKIVKESKNTVKTNTEYANTDNGNLISQNHAMNTSKDIEDDESASLSTSSVPGKSKLQTSRKVKREEFGKSFFENVINDMTDLMQPMKDQMWNVLTTRQNISRSAKEYLEELRLNGFIKHSDIVFSDGLSKIYFTELQQRAIDVFDLESGRYCNIQQLITGPPGCGKSLILLMKLFILKQIRVDKPLIYSSWHEHDKVVKQFVERNRCPKKHCCRDVIFQSEPKRRIFASTARPRVTMLNGYQGHRDVEYNETAEVASAAKSDIYDVVFDERIPNNKLHRFEQLSNFSHTFSIAVFTGGFRLESSIDDYLKAYIEPTKLTTVFRSTNTIQRYFSENYGSPIFSGHTFDGVPIERRQFALEDDAIRAAEERIEQLCHMFGSAYSKSNVAVIVELSSALYRLYNPAMYITHKVEDVPSLEFPIVLCVCFSASAKKLLPIVSSRAICHLIVHEYDEMSMRTAALQNHLSTENPASCCIQ